MSADRSDRSTTARLAKASELLNILARELHIAVAEASDSEPRVSMLSSISSRLAEQALDLAEITFATAEDAVASSGDPRAERSAATLGRVSRIIEPVFEVASEIAAHLAICAEKAAQEGTALTSATLSRLDLPIIRLLAENQHLITGAGVAAAPGAVKDVELWMQWWVHGQSGPRQLLPQLERMTPGFYDYPSAVWFRESARDLAPHMAPPHFDEGGTDTWMVTAIVPVVVRQRLVGLACAELTLERVEALVMPALRAMPAPAALVSPEGGIVASTHPDLRPGARTESQWHLPRSTGAPFTELSPGVTVARSPAVPWMIVTDWTLKTG